MRRAAALAGALLLAAAPARAESVAPYAIVGDAIPMPLAGAKGDAKRGQAIVGDRQVGLCLLCHPGPFANERAQGTIGPDLRGAGARWSEGQLRLRLVDSQKVNPETIMPPFHRTQGLSRVAGAFRGRPILDAQQIEDAVTYLQTLTD
ncbi:MAG: sulfur oxidation c-type cytochrome SoxX [Rhodospirillales bacterium]|nr:sulfur oxidation c-type cytochrome SoxX [Rhodospirillales bacterium]